MDVKYIGRSHRRTIRGSDMAAQGIDGFETTTWSKQGTETTPAAVGKWLTENLPLEFQVDEGGSKAKKSASAPTDSSSTPSGKS